MACRRMIFDVACGRTIFDVVCGRIIFNVVCGREGDLMEAVNGHGRLLYK